MKILKKGIVPEILRFTCKHCGCEFECMAWEDGIIQGRDTDGHDVWGIRCPTEGCNHSVLLVMSEQQRKLFDEGFTPQEKYVEEVLPSRYIPNGSGRDGDNYGCPYCEQNWSYWFQGLPKSRYHDGAVVCESCHQAFIIGKGK